ncbi:hypothetical protein CCACVL1_20638 [Corchorus capsularis]|uniref:cytokinin dehydrogenase n=1 Tax=Corchorus capsularis TaxID=210143 RepID=A0A1R3HAL5_COCAP|nr:hypothetical protein CCACVL1_20638 [Corchorus capsularis]
MATSFPIPAYFTALFIISRLMSIIGLSKPWNNVSPKILTLDIADKISVDPLVIESTSQDFGHIEKSVPEAVLYPSSVQDIATLIKFSYNNNSVPFSIAAKGHGHSVRGQAMANNGVVVDMGSLRKHRNGTGAGIEISNDGVYADVGGEQLWIDVLNATLERGLAPVSWTDYLYLTVGKADFLTCSPKKNSELFYAVLGGLGQFGIITRARIPLEPAPKRVKWVRMLYNDFSGFTKDQELLISKNGRKDKNALDYLEGSLLMDQGSPDNWRSSFFPPSDHPRITSLITKHRIIYCLEVVKHYYDHDQTKTTVDKELEQVLKGLNYMPGFMFEKDVEYAEFLNRVRSGELKLKSQGLWDVPHPWLNLFIPKSKIAEFNDGVFKGIVLKRNITTGPVLLYPMNRNKWDDRMSAVIPEEETFYTVGFLHSSGFDDWEAFDDQNKEIMKFCDEVGLGVKKYLPHYTTKEEWTHHFGSKWNTFQQRKLQFDPKMILSPGHRIFNDN